MRLIDADALLKHFWDTKLYKLSGQFEKLIFNMPSIDPVHAAGRCYCFECKNHTHDEVFGTRICKITNQRMRERDFCSYGEKEEG